MRSCWMRSSRRFRLRTTEKERAKINSIIIWRMRWGGDRWGGLIGRDTRRVAAPQAPAHLESRQAEELARALHAALVCEVRLHLEHTVGDVHAGASHLLPVTAQAEAAGGSLLSATLWLDRRVGSVECWKERLPSTTIRARLPSVPAVALIHLLDAARLAAARGGLAYDVLERG
jgi:hypothetical protein